MTAEIAQEPGNSETAVMSQKAVSDIYENLRHGQGYTSKEGLIPYIDEIIVFGADEIKASDIMLSDTQVLLNLRTADNTLVASTNTVTRDKSIYEIKPIDDSGISGYVIFNGLNIEMTSFTDAFLTEKAFDISYSGKIGAYLQAETIKSTRANTTNILANIVNTNDIVSPVLCNNAGVSSAIEEMLILGIDYDDGLYINNLKVTEQSVMINIFNRSGNSVFFDVFDRVGDTDHVYVHKNEDGSQLYFILTGEDFVGSGMSYDTVISAKAFELKYQGKLQNYFLKAYGLSNDSPLPPKWTTYAIYDNYIKELYLPNLSERYGDSCSITDLLCKSSVASMNIRDADNNILANVSLRISPFYYKSNAITPIYDFSTGEIVGWIVFAFSGQDYAISGRRSLNYPIVTNVENSPSIKSMLSSDKQIIITGDSFWGGPGSDYAYNPMQDIIRGLLRIKVWNIACGGAQMSWRSADGSNYYDKFSWADIADAIAGNDFSAQITANENRGSKTNYSWQCGNMQNIDMSLQTTIFSDYGGNDFSNAEDSAGNELTSLGTLWNYSDDSDNSLKTSLLGAHAYGVSKILASHPTIRIVFSTFAYTLRSGVPPYAQANSLGNTLQEYEEKLIDNCKRLGIPYHQYNGIRSFYNISSYATDGVHNSGLGYSDEARRLVEIYKSYLY